MKVMWVQGGGRHAEGSTGQGSLGWGCHGNSSLSGALPSKLRCGCCRFLGEAGGMCMSGVEEQF